MKHITQTRTALLLAACVLLSAGYVAGQQADRLSIRISRSLLDTTDENTAAYTAAIKTAAKDPAQVSEVIRVAYSFPQHSSKVLGSLQVEQNAVIIEQNKRIIELLEQQARK